MLADRRSPTRHSSTAPIFGELQIPAALRKRWLHELLNDCARRPPKVLVTKGALPEALAQPVPPRCDTSPLTLASWRYDWRAKVGKFEIYERGPAQIATAANAARPTPVFAGE